jgi:Xaa-Pro aminopeptidase
MTDMSARGHDLARAELPKMDLARMDLARMDLAGRVDRLRAQLGGAACDALLVSNLSNLRYLTGFSGSAGLLMVREDEAVLVTDGRYKTQVQRELEASGADARAVALRADEQPGLLGQLVKGVARLGLEAEDVSWAKQRRWAQTWAAGTELVATSGLVERLRERKDEGEIARIAAAAAIADQALANVQALLAEFPTEAEMAIALDAEMRRLGADEPAFETIVAAGPNGAEPHHRPTRRRIGRQEMVTIDFGARLDGYCSDMTRTLLVGPGQVAQELHRVFAVVLTSQDAGLSAVRDGVRAAEVDRACREVVEAAGWGDLFLHGTGHGVGLNVHEAPSLGIPSQDILRCGQVVTVEPGVYVAGLGGARTEDTVVVTEAGCEILTKTPREVYAL